MSKKKIGLLLILLFWLPLILIDGSSVLAYPTLNVGLTRFEAVPLDNAVRLEWDTETELNTAGFMLKRGQDGSYDYLADPAGSSSLFISSEGSPAVGYNYSYVDETVLNGEIYTYKLIEVEVDGSEIDHAESTVKVGIVPTNTPIVLDTGIGGGSNDDNASTATPTATTQTTSGPAATTQGNNPTAPSPTPFSTPIPPAPTVVITDETAENVSNDTAPDVNSQSNTNNEESFVQSEEQVNTSADGIGVAVALAQEEPESYPGVESADDPVVESPSENENVGISEPQAPSDIGQDSDIPEVIGSTEYPVDSPAPDAAPTQQDNTQTSSDSGLAGQVYLCVAFLAALVIFTAAVLGAILLYTRQRSKE